MGGGLAKPGSYIYIYIFLLKIDTSFVCFLEMSFQHISDLRINGDIYFVHSYDISFSIGRNDSFIIPMALNVGESLGWFNLPPGIR